MNNYTPAEDTLIRDMRESRSTIGEIAATLGRSHHSIEKRIARLAIKRIASPVKKSVAVADVLSALQEGKTVLEISQLTNWNEPTIRRWARQFCTEEKLTYKANYAAQNGAPGRRKETISPENAVVQRVVKGFPDGRKMCRKRSLDFNLDVAWANATLQKQKGKCYYTGALMTSDFGRRAATVDRLDSSVGYIKDNCVLACHAANTAKNTMALDKFIRLCHAVAQTHPLT